MSPAFEAFLARLYVDADARERFLRDPHGEAARARLSPAETAALTHIDRTGLELAAHSFAAKRRASHAPATTSGPLGRWLSRLLGRRMA